MTFTRWVNGSAGDSNDMLLKTSAAKCNFKGAQAFSTV